MPQLILKKGGKKLLRHNRCEKLKKLKPDKRIRLFYILTVKLVLA